uniref:G-protein coupled receptors family 1 profile domain-containing protein n=1 Tax=Naja naja TaxID=35670 RepID=A0A8C6XN92_NAJNA
MVIICLAFVCVSSFLPDHHGRFSAPVTVLLAILMGFLVLVTVLGNALVILAFVVDKSLRTQGNFFFLNLALADILVGGFCIPLYIPYILTNEWKFGKGLCKLWLVVDYLVCTASGFNIVLISFDRFVSVTRAVSYRVQKGMTKTTVAKMATVWIAAFLLYGPAIISWEYIAQQSIIPENKCYAEFHYNWYFLMIASTIEFFTPFISVTYFNLSIYFNIRKRTPVRSESSAAIKSELGTYLSTCICMQMLGWQELRQGWELTLFPDARVSNVGCQLSSSQAQRLIC